MNKGPLLYEGKAKKIFSIPGEDDLIWVEYKDDLTAFNAQKKGSFDGKGLVNAQITLLLYSELAKRGVQTHIVSETSKTEMVCRKLTIIPLEVVTRNRLAGSTAKKFGLEEGSPLPKPLVEFYYKNDALNDPFVSDDQALMLKAANDRAELDELRRQALQINTELQFIFKEVGLELIDFKLEFGRDSKGKIILGDEVSPDTCRLWDLKTQEKMDKDRFRRDLGNVEETYNDVLKRLKDRWSR